MRSLLPEALWRLWPRPAPSDVVAERQLADMERRLRALALEAAVESGSLDLNGRAARDTRDYGEQTS